MIRDLVRAWVAFGMASQIWSTFKFFRSPEKLPPEFKLVQAIAWWIVGSTVYVLWPAIELPEGRGAAALALTLLGVALFWWTVKAGRKGRFQYLMTREAPASLVEEGPYRFVRHPFYLSYLLQSLALFAYWPRVITLANFLTLCALYWVGSSREERLFLEGPLRESYLAYQRRAGRFIPRPRCRP
jgi:protein-S-isoprenylcysteine O-methyltransferase Ste14